MIRISNVLVTLMVDDLDRSVDFYTARLGFVTEFRADPHFAVVGRNGLRLGLHPRGDGPGAGESSGISIGLEVDDIEESVAVLESAGERFPTGILEDGPPRRADFADPDGTALYLVESSAGSR